MEELCHHARIESAVAEGAKNVMKLLGSGKVTEKKAHLEVNATFWELSKQKGVLSASNSGLSLLGLVFFQAQARFNESSQKLDLLRHSLELRLNELPKSDPRSHSIIEELSLLSSPALSPRSSFISTQNQYSTVTKPAALTGKHHPPHKP